MDAASTEASSLRMSPKVFSDTMTSKLAGRWMICMAQLSTSTCSSSTPGYSSPSLVATERHNREHSRTLALSTEVSFLRRPMASSNPTRTIRSISPSV